MEVFLSVVAKVAVILVLIVVGYVCIKRNMISEKGISDITAVLLRVVTPCVIVNSFLTAERGQLDLVSLALAVVLPALSIFISVALSYLLFRKEPLDRRKVLRFSVIFSNVGFMGVPLVQGIVGKEGVLFSSFFIAMFNLVCWTYGYVMMGAGKMNVKNMLLNPGVIGLCIGLPLYFLDVQLPEIIASPVEMICDLNTPLAMIVVGGYIARVELKTCFADKAVWSVSFWRLLVSPAIYLVLALLIRPQEPLLMSTVVQAATPVAANCVLFAAQYGGDAALASKNVAVSTALSVITIPVFTVITQLIFPLLG